MKTKLLEYAKKVAETHQVSLIYLTMDGSHVSGLRNPKGDVDVIGVFVSDRITSTYFRDKTQLLIDEQGHARGVDIVLYNIHYVMDLVKQQQLFGYRYFANTDNVILPCPRLTNQIPKLYKHEAAVNSMMSFLWREIKELEGNLEREEERYLYKQARYITQDICAISQYIQTGKVKAFTYRNYLPIKMSLPFRLLVLKRLRCYDCLLSTNELRLVLYEFHRMQLDAQQKWRVNEMVPYPEIESLTRELVSKYTNNKEKKK